MNFNLPQEIQPNHIIGIRGQIAEHANEYWISFANDISYDPPDIAYHFKCDLVRNAIVQTMKQNGEWMDPDEQDNEALDGPDIALDFAFSSDEVTVYTAGHNLVTSFQLEHDLSEIKAIQVGGDVMRITELTFKFN